MANNQFKLLDVAPHAGAWIEIEHRQLCIPCHHVAPHAGAWIEIVGAALGFEATESHLTQVRGLKFLSCKAIQSFRESHLTQVRGLKF